MSDNGQVSEPSKLPDDVITAIDIRLLKGKDGGNELVYSAAGKTGFFDLLNLLEDCKAVLLLKQMEKNQQRVVVVPANQVAPRILREN